MKNKGMTVIELLGSIVILAVVALITIPIVTNVITKSKLKALQNSAYGLVDAANLYYAQYPENKRFDSENNTLKDLSYKGSIKNGVVIIDKKGKVTVCINDGKNSAYKNYNEEKVTVSANKNCSIPNNTYIVYLDGEATRNELSNQELTDQVDSINQQISAMQTKIEALEAENNTLKEQQSPTNTELSTTLGTLSSTVSSNNTSLSNRITSNANSISTINSKLSNIKLELIGSATANNGSDIVVNYSSNIWSKYLFIYAESTTCWGWGNTYITNSAKTFSAPECGGTNFFRFEVYGDHARITGYSHTGDSTVQDSLYIYGVIIK